MAPEPSRTPSAADVESALARVVASQAFVNSKRLQRFLTYIVTKQLQGEGAKIKEYAIALEVFDKDPSFDPRSDTIVRVEARRLRHQLAAYYAGEGCSDDLIIHLPRGGYAPAFVHRTATVQPPASTPRALLPASRTTILTTAAVVIGVAALALWIGGELRFQSEPAHWEFDGARLRILDESDRLCWEERIEGLSATYAALPGDKVVIDDIDADGRKEVLVNRIPQSPNGNAGSLLCLDHRGGKKWEVKFGRARTIAERSFDQEFIGRFIKPLRAGGRPFLLTVANHYLWYPAQIALLDPATGRTVEEYWHPGAIHHILVRDLNRDGAEELLFGAINNPGPGMGHAAIGILPLPLTRSTNRLAGELATPPPYFDGGVELGYILLPQPDVNEAGGVLPILGNLSIDSQARIAAELPAPEYGGIVFHLDTSLRVLEHRFSDNFGAIHDSFYRQRALDHKFTPAEAALLGRVMRFRSAPDGNSPEVRRLWNPKDAGPPR